MFMFICWLSQKKKKSITHGGRTDKELKFHKLGYHLELEF